MDNISLKLFTFTCKRKHFAVLKSQKLFTPQNNKGGNYYLQHTQEIQKEYVQHHVEHSIEILK